MQALGEGSGYGLPKGQDNDVIGPLGIPSLPVMEKKSAVQVKSTTSGSSRQQSDDETEGETKTNNMEPTDAKRVRRMLSNGESARCSRRRKQAHLTELETQSTEQIQGVLNLIDLAGSERLSKIGSTSDRLKETHVRNLERAKKLIGLCFKLVIDQ